MPDAAMMALWGTVGAALGAWVAAYLAWRRPTATWSRWVLVAAGGIGLIPLVVAARPFGSPRVALAALGVALGLWGGVLEPAAGRTRAWVGAVAGVLMAGSLGMPPLLWATSAARQGWFGLAEAGYVLAVGIILWGGMDLLARGFRDGGRRQRAALGTALLFLTAALVLQGIGAQRTWGTYWSWDPLECWWLVTWLVTAGAAWGVERMGWGRRRTAAALWLAAGIAVGILFGAWPLVHGLGLGSLYLAG